LLRPDICNDLRRLSSVTIFLNTVSTAQLIIIYMRFVILAEETASVKSKPFERLMSGVVFVLSGFQNPERSNLRDAALEMGATYRPDWGKGCTHLM
jgi:DNA-repair protein XRCC1